VLPSKFLDATCLARSEQAWIVFSNIRSTARCSVVSVRTPLERATAVSPSAAVVLLYPFELRRDDAFISHVGPPLRYGRSGLAGDGECRPPVR
jgi:hypothetical protein